MAVITKMGYESRPNCNARIDKLRSDSLKPSNTNTARRIYVSCYSIMSVVLSNADSLMAESKGSKLF